MEQTSLNVEQKKAVVATEGPLLILAGAGSGKTKALTHRIAYLLDECHVSPYEILALTFTNKASHEMKERIELLAGELGSRVWVSTFHACCARILRVNIEELGTFTRNFVIYDEADQLVLIKQIQAELKINEDVVSKRVLRSIFSQAKNCSLSPERYIAEADSRMSETYAQAYSLYQRTLQKNNALDFDDLLLRTMELFDRCPAVLEHYQRRFRYVHVDEYQDTNAIQYEFVKKLSAGFGNLCVVGDDDQSIYGWRGADLRNILEFEKDYPNATVLRLEQNYRSTKTILDAANAVIAQNKARKKKTLWTENEMGDAISIYKAHNDREEANFVCDKIIELTRNGGRYDDSAVLYRTNAQARVLEDTLVAYGIPYVVYGSLRFYDRKEIKDVLAFLRLMINPHDDISLRRVINVPKRGIGDASVNELAECANERGVSLFEACLQAETLDLKTRARKKIIDFGHLLAQLQALSELLPLCDFMNELMTLTKYLDYLQEEAKKEGKSDETRVDNVQELLHAIAEFEENFSDTENVLSAYLENVSLVANVKDEESTDAVVLMTIHSAKGLEFPTVFVVGCEEEIFPSSRSKFSEELLEEERRLCYVAMTRAKERLFLSHARSRMQYNNFKYNPPSRFLEEIPPELCCEIKEEKETTEFSFARTTPQFKSESKQYESAPVASAKRKASATKKNAIHFEIGQRVEHAKFGEGNIIDMAGNVLTIVFKENGTKKIAGNYAPLTIKE